jgi:hypothetical protein
MKGRKHKATGGVNDAEMDVKEKPADRTEPSGPSKEAEEMKKGGRAKRKHGGKAEMKVHGEKSHEHAGRKPRKSGGRAGSDKNPFTSAKSGKDPKGHEVMKISED